MKIFKKILLGGCALCSLAVVATSALFAPNQAGADKNTQISFTDIDLQTSYNVGDKLTLPQCTILDGENQVKTVATLIYPDGTAQTGATQNLSINGEYKLVYTGYVDGKAYTKTHTFLVNSPLYNLYGEDSANVIIPEYKETEYGTGLLVSLHEGEVFTLSQPIDLSGRTRADGLWTMNSVPEVFGVYDSDIVFKLTDTEDETNSVLIRLAKYPADEEWTTWQTFVYLSIDGGDNWVSLRYIQNGTGQYEYEGFTYHCQKNYQYGAQLIYSTVGMPHSSIPSVKDQALTFSYEPESKAFFVRHSKFSDHYPGLDYMPLYDFDDERFNDVTWKGFTNNTVYLSVYGANYLSPTSHVLFTNIDNRSIRNNLIKDTTPPTIDVDFEGFEESTIPSAVVGKGYKIFDAKWNDTDVNTKMKVRVYSNYYSVNRVYVPIANNKFVPNRAGEYFIEYTATDGNGNQTQRVVLVNATDRETNLTASLTGIIESCVAGKSVKLFTDVAIENVIGKGYYSVAVISPDGEKTYEIEKDNSFRFPYAGAYKVRIVYGDFIEEKTQDYTITVSNSSTPIAFEKPLLENYYIKDATYTFPALTAYNIVGSEQKPVQTQLYIKADDGTEEKVTGKYTVIAQWTLEIIYKAGEHIVYQSDKKSVVDVRFNTLEMDLSAYFVEDGFIKRADKSYTEFVVSDTENNRIEFIRPVQAKDLDVAFMIDGERSNYKRLNVYLSDCIDATQTIKISYWLGESKVYYTINDGDSVYSFSSYLFNLTYKDFILSSSADTSALIDTTMYGEPFKGFTEDKVFLSMDMEGGVANESAFYFVSINGQTFTESHFDTTRPQILYDKVQDSKNLNEIITISKAYMVDVLDPDVQITFYVLGTENEYVTSVDGVVLDGTASIDRAYDIQLSRYGSYTVVYNATDTAGNKYKDQVYVIECKDTVSPMIELNGKVEVIKSGNTAQIAKCTAVDNVTENCDIYVYVITPTGKVIKVENGGWFTMEYYGEYTVHYSVFDENYNMSKISYKITRSK